MQYIECRQQRDFGEILGATFSFLRQNFVKMLKPLLAFSVIPILIGSVLMSSSYFEMLSFIPRNASGGVMPPSVLRDFGFSFMLGYPLLIIGIIMFYLVINSYIKLYSNKEDLSMGAVFQEMKSRFWSYLGGSILAGLVIGFGFMLCGIPGIYFGVVFSLILISMSVENIGGAASISRSMALIKNEWWGTFGLLIVVNIIQMMIVGIFSIPMYLYMFLGLLHSSSGGMELAESIDSMSIGLIVFTSIYYIGALFTSSLSAIAIAFKYFSLVEQKEGIGDLEKIDSIGEN